MSLQQKQRVWGIMKKNKNIFFWVKVKETGLLYLSIAFENTPMIVENKFTFSGKFTG